MEEEAGIAAKKKRESTFGKVTTNCVGRSRSPQGNISGGKGSSIDNIHGLAKPFSDTTLGPIEF